MSFALFLSQEVGISMLYRSHTFMKVCGRFIDLTFDFDQFFRKTRVRFWPCSAEHPVLSLMLIGPNAPWRPCELASQLGGVIWGAEMVVRLENELLLVHVLDG